MSNTKSSAKIIGVSAYGTTLAAAAGRISTTNGTALQIFEKSVDNPNNAKLIKAVLSSGHRSTMEHCFFNMAFNNVSAFVEQYIIEFRLASFTVQSRRYVDFSKVGFFSAMEEGEAKTLYENHVRELFATYERLLSLDIPKEDARFVLPYCFHSNFYCSANARELLHMIATMIYGRGSVFTEIKALGKELAAQFEEYFPGELARQEKAYVKEANASANWLAAHTGKKAAEPTVAAASTTLLTHSALSTEALLDAATCNFATLPEDADLYSGRKRELELVSLTYRISDLTLSAITHLVRHRIQSVLVPLVGTALYQNHYVMPASVKACPEAEAIYTAAFEKNRQVFNTLVDMGIDASYSVYLVLSGNTMDLISSMNGREFVHYCALRTCNRAQWEIREVAISMLRQARAVLPHVFHKVGPGCYMNGVCPEGSKTCGEAIAVKKFFSEL